MLLSVTKMKHAWQKTQRNAKDEEPFYMPIGILMFAGFLGFYFIWKYFSHTGYDSLALRLIACGLSIPLIFHRYWPRRLDTLKTIYWYLTLLYIIPFFFTFLLFKNNGSYLWQLNGLWALVILILLVDWITFITLYAIGITIAISIYYLITPHPELPRNIIALAATYIPVLLFCTLFLYKRSKINLEKLNTMKMLGATVAHELRTPLSAIAIGISGIKRKCKKENLYNEPAVELESSLELLKTSVDEAHQVINLMLTNLHYGGEQIELQHEPSIREVVKLAIDSYIFHHGNKEMIVWTDTKDFAFNGNRDLIIHVLHNLMKNAFYFMHHLDHPRVELSVGSNTKGNYLSFKDCGIGIPEERLPFIFDQFYSHKTHHGSGVGLAFCKSVMEAHKGAITCQSKVGEFTEFKLNFPICETKP